VRSLRLTRVRGFDVLVVGVAVAAELEIELRDLQGPKWLLLTAVWSYTLPLLARRRWPLGAPLFVIVVQVVVSFLDVPGSVRENWGVVAYVLAFWVLASDNTLRKAILGLVVGLAGIVVVALEDPRVPPREAFTVAVYASLTWLAGAALRQRRLRIAQAESRSAALEQDHRETHAAVAEERARIARELHDVVAHSVSVMTVQAGAARMTLGTDPDRALEALLAVEETGRQALDELRRLLYVLRPDQLRPDHIDTALAPQPGLDNLPELVESVRGTGLPVELVTDGVVRPVAPGLGLTVYRIVQEALTNTLKHAAAHQVRVLVNYGPQQLQVEVRDDGSRPSHTTAKSSGEGGHGLAGMRERAALYGGEVHVGPGEDGGYLVSAKLPIGQSAP
jgi:signal transduction histidine kinase